jgi:c(7)-type cytochrome triheme protein
MRYFLMLVLLAGVAGVGLVRAADEAAGPAKFVFQSKTGPVTYPHAAHIAQESGKCETCHPAIFPKSSRAPLKYNFAGHKPYEQVKSSCGFCHREGGKAFKAEGNCSRCHGKKPAA